MTIKDEWLDPQFVRRWDQDPPATNPVRDEQMDIIVSILEGSYRPGQYILDIGMGSGQVEEAIFRRIPHAQVVGIDYSQPMLDLAAERLRPYGHQYVAVKHDLRDLDSLRLPHTQFQYIVTSQVLHELPHQDKRRVFALARRLLAPDGTFLITDRVRLPEGYLYDACRAVWQRLRRLHPNPSYASFDDVFRAYQVKEDFPATLEEHLSWLREAGFKAACLFFHLNRFIIGAQPAHA